MLYFIAVNWDDVFAIASSPTYALAFNGFQCYASKIQGHVEDNPAAKALNCCYDKYATRANGYSYVSSSPIY